ncbi:hypothetical protein HERIO_373 [Hepatospora eriocheir]|uniref:Uncharacterized protein n=1 Tax=Hepatospora eriocheir TaxID=1081669 RepID=A0A1X0QDF4_9MICR|nr:hypothetical protein HERIO_373 [Hepatospora eriocheir]
MEKENDENNKTVILKLKENETEYDRHLMELEICRVFVKNPKMGILETERLLHKKIGQIDKTYDDFFTVFLNIKSKAVDGDPIKYLENYCLNESSKWKHYERK